LVLNLGYSKGNERMLSNHHSIGCLRGQKCCEQYRYYLQTMNVNRTSTLFGTAAWMIKSPGNCVDPFSNYRLFFWANMLSTMSQPHPKIECLRSVNSFCGGLASYTPTYCTALCINQVISHQSSLSVPIFNFTHLHAMSHRSDI
jgi:hypothetical protein